MLDRSLGPDDPLSNYAEAYPGASRRTLMHKRAAVRALAALAGDDAEIGEGELVDRWPWLLDGLSGGRLRRQTILYVLGEVGDAAATREIAEVLEQLRPSVRDAIMIVRRFRARREGRNVAHAATFDEVMLRLSATLTTLVAEYPSTSRLVLAEALDRQKHRLTEDGCVRKP